jgi:short subunit dehydrogenase-like uncharacterized protein
MKKRNGFLIYGAYGYTGELITELAVKQGQKPLLGGRNAQKLQKLADKFQLPYQVFDLNESDKLDTALQAVDAVLHIAGPFSATAETMVKACIKNKVHYLDVTGEIDVFEWIATQDQAAKQAGIVLMPGVGFDVVPSDCLAAYLKSKMPEAIQLEIAIKSIAEASRGTMLTMIEGMNKGGKVREQGSIRSVPMAYHTRDLVFQGKKESLISVPWGDVSTAFFSTQIPTIYTYMFVDSKIKAMAGFSRYFGWFLGLSPIQSVLKWQVKNTMTGPDVDYRAKAKSYVWGEVRDMNNKTLQAFVETKEAYTLTAETALASVLRALKGEVKAGFQTPATAFGADFILTFEGSKRFDL